MSHSVNEDDLFPAAVVVPDVNDIDYYTSVPQGVGQVTNRTRHLRNTLMGEAGGVGESLADADISARSPFFATLLPTAARAALFRISFQHVLGRIKYEAERITTNASAVFGTTSTIATMNVPIVPQYVTSAFGASATSNVFYWTQLDVTGPPSMAWPLPCLPVTGTIKGFEVYVRGQPGSHAGLPATLPTVSLYRQVVNSTTLVGTVTDASASVSAYEDVHAIATASLGETISHTNAYFLKLTGEGGAGAVGFGLFIYTCRIYIEAAT